MLWKRKKAIKKLSKYIAFSDYTKGVLAMSVDLYIQGKMSKEILHGNLKALNDFANENSPDYVINEKELDFEAYIETQTKTAKDWQKKITETMKKLKDNKKEDNDNRDRMII